MRLLDNAAGNFEPYYRFASVLFDMLRHVQREIISSVQVFIVAIEKKLNLFKWLR